MHTTRPIPASTQAKSPAFDGLSFLRYMKNIGRQYKKQATELVSICRLFAQAQDQNSRSYDDLRSVLEVVDDALGSAAAKTPKDVDEKFKKAIKALSAYEKRCYAREIVAKRMVEAGAKDKSSSSTLSRLKEKFVPLKVEKMETVEFLLHKSLPDRSPTIVKQVLGQSSNLNEVLWNFGRFRDEKKRLTLKQNPHFYDSESLPILPEKYGSKFETGPVDTFQHKRISVLTDNSGPTGRVFLETSTETRAFGNVWVPSDAIIFKDVCGKLEGESIVGEAIKDTPIWCLEELLPSPSSRSPNRSSPSPTSNTTPTTPSLLNGDWREPIRRMLRSLSNVNIRISAKPPTNSSPSYSIPSSPIPPSDSSSIAGSLPLALQSRPPITVQIPGASTVSLNVNGPLSPSSYKTARSTPLSERPPAAEPSPRSLAPLFPELQFTLSTHPMSAPVPSTAAPSPTVAVPLSGPANPLPGISSREVCREVSASSGDPIPSRASIAEVSSSGPNVTITSPWAIDPFRPSSRIEHNEAAEHVPIQLPDPSTVPTAVPNHLTAVPTAVVPTTAPPVATVAPKQKQKRHWYQKCFDVIKNKVLPGSL